MTSKPKLAWRWLPPPPKFGGPPVTNIRNTSSPQWRGWLKPEMPALRTNRVGGGPLHAAVLDFISEPENRGDAGKCHGWRRGEPPTRKCRHAWSTGGILGVFVACYARG